MRRACWKAISLGALVAFLSTSALGVGLAGSVGAGSVSMAFLNGQLEFTADRAGTTFSPLRLAWGGRVDVWPWAFLGVGGSWLSVSGQTHGRDPQRQSVNAWGVSVNVRLPEIVRGWPVGIRAGAGVAWAGFEGLITAGGLGWDLSAAVEWRVLQLGPLSAVASVGARYFPVPVARDGRGNAVETRGMPAADFSGLFASIALRWR